MFQVLVMMTFKLRYEGAWIFTDCPFVALGFSLFLQEYVSLMFTMVSYSLNKTLGQFRLFST